MGSGLGSVPLPRLLRAVEAVPHAAADGHLQIAAQAVPLAEYMWAHDLVIILARRGRAAYRGGAFRAARASLPV